MQGGVRNYLGKQKTIKDVPIKWKSAPNHPQTELAYITKAEKDLLLKKNLHDSLDGGPNRGPGGLMSLNGGGYGSEDKGTNDDGSNNPGGGSDNNRESYRTAQYNTPAPKPAPAPKTSPMQDAQQERKSKEVGFDQNDKSNPYSEASKTAIDNFNQDIADRQSEKEREVVLEQLQFASEKKGGFFNTGFGWTELGMAALYAFNPVLGAKIGKLKTAYNTAKFIGDTTGLYNATKMKDDLLSQFSNPKGSPIDKGSENQWWASTLTGDNKIGSDNQESDNQFFREVGAPEGIMEITEDMKMKKTAPTENVIGSLPNANQQSVMSGPTYTRSNVANESEKGIPNVKGIGESFADVFKTDTNIPEDGEGSSALLKEYAMLLKQMEQGLLQTEGRERLNILKSRLGLAQGGITNVNMNKGKPEEVLRKLGEVLYG